MTWVRDTNSSVRDNIMEHLRDRFLSVNPGAIGYERFTTQWLWVERAPIRKPEIIMGPCLSVMDVKEKKKPGIGYQLCDLQLVLEFFCNPMEGDTPLVLLNRILQEIVWSMRSDIYCGQMALNAIEVGSELEIGSATDRTAHGVSFWTITYRHSVDDPTKLLGE